MLPTTKTLRSIIVLANINNHTVLVTYQTASHAYIKITVNTCYAKWRDIIGKTEQFIKFSYLSANVTPHRDLVFTVTLLFAAKSVQTVFISKYVVHSLFAWKNYS